jgi:8-oxo-dGTP diphosphatase
MHICVGAIIVRARQVLLGQRAANRNFYPNVWNTFGGHIEPGEQPEQALARELREELGITPTRWSPLGTRTDLLQDQPGRPAVQLALTLYCVTAWSGTPRNLQPHEHAQICWLTLDQVAELELAHPAYPQIIAGCLADRRRLDGHAR